MIDNHSEKFRIALINKDLTAIKSTPKADLHNHAALGGNSTNFGLKPLKKYDGYKGMKNYISQVIAPCTKALLNYQKYIDATLLQAIDDGITYLETSIDFRFIEMFPDIDSAIIYLENLKNLHKNVCEIHFDLGISRGSFNEFEKACELLTMDIFSGIDLYGNENSRDVRLFEKLFLYAKSKNKICKAHIGEYGTAQDIYEAVRILNLDEIQHGINVISDPYITQKIRSLNIVFNVCITGNIKMGIVKDYFSHPIRKMFDSGLKVTLNTDDFLLFNQSISEEFLNLYLLKIFNDIELDAIRILGLRRKR